MPKVLTFEQVNPAAAAIDIGAHKIFVSTDGTSVKSYLTFTADYRTLIDDLHQGAIKSVCMEATGIYWIALHQMLEAGGFEVCLVNPKEVKQVKGRKSDPADCRWIQKMFSAGLVRQSYVPAGKLRAMRMLVREREDIIEMGSTYVNKMGKCLELMNLKLGTTLSQIQGASGLRMIEAIIAGERDPQALLALCDKRIIKAKSEDVLKALEGDYDDNWIFLLESSVTMWKRHQQQLSHIDRRIAVVLEELEAGCPVVESGGEVKAVRHHRPQVAGLHQKLLNIYGADGNSIPGINDYTLLRLLGEMGSDMSRFPSGKHFVSWAQLSPAVDRSGKSSRRVRSNKGSRTGQILREAAQSLMASKYNAIGVFMRRVRSRKDSKTAIKAGARKLGMALYNLLTKGAAYVEQGNERYEAQQKEREKSYLLKLAAKHGMQLNPQLPC